MQKYNIGKDVRTCQFSQKNVSEGASRSKWRIQGRTDRWSGCLEHQDVTFQIKDIRSNKQGLTGSGRNTDVGTVHSHRRV